jgi:hypothetical protein
MKSVQYKTAIIFLSGFITPIMQLFVPVASGGVSLIFVFSIPILIGLAIIFAVAFKILLKYPFGKSNENLIFCVLTAVTLALTLLYFPYK